MYNLHRQLGQSRHQPEADPPARRARSSPARSRSGTTRRSSRRTRSSRRSTAASSRSSAPTAPARATCSPSSASRSRPTSGSAFIAQQKATREPGNLTPEFLAGQPTSIWPQEGWGDHPVHGRERRRHRELRRRSRPAAPNAITYVAAGYAKVRNFPTASVQNAAGVFTQPDEDNVTVALGYAQTRGNGTFQLAFNGPDPRAYFPSTYSYVLAQTTGFDPGKGATLGQFLCYAVSKGQVIAPQLRYARLSSVLVNIAIDAIVQIPGAPPAAHCPVAGAPPPPPPPPVVVGGIPDDDDDRKRNVERSERWHAGPERSERRFSRSRSRHQRRNDVQLHDDDDGQADQGRRNDNDDNGAVRAVGRYRWLRGERSERCGRRRYADERRTAGCRARPRGAVDQARGSRRAASRSGYCSPARSLRSSPRPSGD